MARARISARSQMLRAHLARVRIRRFRVHAPGGGTLSSRRRKRWTSWSRARTSRYFNLTAVTDDDVKSLLSPAGYFRQYIMVFRTFSKRALLILPATNPYNDGGVASPFRRYCSVHCRVHIVVQPPPFVRATIITTVINIPRRVIFFAKVSRHFPGHRHACRGISSRTSHTHG